MVPLLNACLFLHLSIQLNKDVSSAYCVPCAMLDIVHRDLVQVSKSSLEHRHKLQSTAK